MAVGAVLRPLRGGLFLRGLVGSWKTACDLVVWDSHGDDLTFCMSLPGMGVKSACRVLTRSSQSLTTKVMGSLWPWHVNALDERDKG